MKHVLKIGFTFFFFCLSAMALSACQKDEPPQSAPQEKQKPVYNPEKAAQKSKAHIVIEANENAPADHNADYLKLTLTNSPNAPLSNDASWVPNIAPEDAKVALLVAHVKHAKTKFPPIPIEIFHQDGKKWAASWRFNGPLTPLFLTGASSSIDVSLELVFLGQSLKNLSKTAQELEGLLKQELFLHNEQTQTTLAQKSDDFFQRVGLAQLTRFQDVQTVTLDAQQTASHELRILNAQKKVLTSSQLQIQPVSNLIQMDTDHPDKYHQLLSTSLGGQTPRDALGDLETAFWRSPAETLHATCQAISGALGERMGLSANDSARILWQMIHSHSLFQPDIDYQADCVGTSLQGNFAELGLELPGVGKSKPTAAMQAAYNRTLSQVARLLKTPDEASLTKLSQLFADTTQIRDQAHLSFSDSTLNTVEENITPQTDRQTISEYLMSLPLKSYGCYSKGFALNGQSRATLLKIENDPHLWQLTFSFDKDNKINGVKLHQPSQYEYCKAIGGRAADNPCRFTRQTHPNLHNDRCQR